MYWLQVYGYYDRLPAQASVALTPAGAVAPVQVPVSGFSGIDSDSSPIRFRACFMVEAPLDGWTPHPDPRPPVAPGWFSCFDAAAIGAALAQGGAQAVLGQAEVRYGIDRVVALFPDGSARAWNQINPCGAAVFAGDPPPPGCPPPPPRN